MSDHKKSIALGITGCIAAYKGADLCSRLVQNGYNVHVLMTESATKLVTEQTFLTLSRNPVITSLWNSPEWRPEHVALSDQAALLVVAPCTANFIGKLAHGIADDALSTFAVTHTGPILLAPGMNPKMWRNPAVQENVELLKKRGILFAGPEAGHVACGPDGVGRMIEVEEILKQIVSLI
ncbi:MAG: flavoprotein [Victivallaceae bacterium]|jgi:phosphopantothenoylcysteine synthetase/decarboxylase